MGITPCLALDGEILCKTNSDTINRVWKVDGRIGGSLLKCVIGDGLHTFLDYDRLQVVDVRKCIPPNCFHMAGNLYVFQVRTKLESTFTDFLHPFDQYNTFKFAATIESLISYLPDIARDDNRMDPSTVFE